MEAQGSIGAAGLHISLWWGVSVILPYLLCVMTSVQWSARPETTLSKAFLLMPREIYLSSSPFLLGSFHKLGVLCWQLLWPYCSLPTAISFLSAELASRFGSLDFTPQLYHWCLYLNWGGIHKHYLVTVEWDKTLPNSNPSFIRKWLAKSCAQIRKVRHSRALQFSSDATGVFFFWLSVRKWSFLTQWMPAFPSAVDNFALFLQSEIQSITGVLNIIGQEK